MKKKHVRMGGAIVIFLVSLAWALYLGPSLPIPEDQAAELPAAMRLVGGFAVQWITRALWVALPVVFVGWMLSSAANSDK